MDEIELHNRMKELAQELGRLAIAFENAKEQGRNPVEDPDLKARLLQHRDKTNALYDECIKDGFKDDDWNNHLRKAGVLGL